MIEIYRPRLLPLLFKLFRCPDKDLRKIMHHHIVYDIRKQNRRHRNEKLNRTLQVVEALGLL